MPPDQQLGLLSPLGWADRFELVEKVGKGAMGQVWKAWEKEAARWVALKLLVSHRVGDLSSVARIEAEGITLMRLNTGGLHPNVVPIYDFAVTEDHACLVMEFIPGKTLAQNMQEEKRDVMDSVALMAKIADACGWFHRLGIVHRDLKPENILLREANGEPVILDFSIAKDEEALMSLTMDQDLGTAAYMAPEQFGIIRDKITPSADVYALGAMLYELVTCMLPFPGDYLEILSSKLAGVRPKLPRLHRPELPPALEGIIWKAMAPSPAERYQDGQALAEDLQRFLSGKTVVRPSGLRRLYLGQMLRRCQRLLLTFCACLSGALSGWFSWDHFELGPVVSPPPPMTSEIMDQSLPKDREFVVETGFTDLFSPEKLPFWRDDDRGGFHFADGIATSWTEEEDPVAGLWIFTEVAFSDFVLRLQFRAKDPTANSGVFLRCQHLPNGFLREACQVQIGNYPPGQPTGSIFGKQSAIELPLRGKDQWNDLEIIAQGPQCIVSLNGVRVNVFEAAPDSQGYLAFQNHMDGVIQLRRVRIRPLKAPQSLPVPEAASDRQDRDMRRQTGRLIPGIDDVFPPLAGSWKVSFKSGLVRHYRIHPDGRIRVAELQGRIAFMQAIEGQAVLEAEHKTVEHFFVSDGELQVERRNFDTPQAPPDLGKGIQIHSAELNEAEKALAEFTQILQKNRWSYQDQDYSSSDVKFGIDGRFHDRWRWKYWVIQPGVIHVQYLEGPRDPAQAVALEFDPGFQHFQGSFTDAKGRKHLVSGRRL